MKAFDACGGIDDRRFQVGIERGFGDGEFGRCRFQGLDIGDGRAVETASPAASTAGAPPTSRADEPAPARFIDPKPGEVYLQVSAVARPEAELLVEVLSRKGFRASMAPGPSENVIRVLVGPASGDSELTKQRTDLEQAGFKAMVRRY